MKSAKSSGFVSLCGNITAASERHFDKPAIVSSSGTLCYGEMLADSCSLADRFFQIAGKSPGLIAISSGDPRVVVISALAAWKTRSAYLVVDPSGPMDRNRQMVREAAAGLLITDGPTSSHWATQVCPVLHFDTNAITTGMDQSQRRTSNGDDEIDSEDIAYVIYTSGSGGSPKGVAITHANLSHLVNWYQLAFDVTPHYRGTQFAALTFDASVLEIWPLLAAGATLHVPDRATVLNPEHLRDFLVAKEITISFAPTAVAEGLLSLPWPCETRLRFLLTGADTLRTFSRPELPFQLVNNYGPTECTVLATSGIVPACAGNRKKPSIGAPIPGVSVYVLDENLQPLPIGTFGQIAIAGKGVGSGYIARPDLSECSFVSNAWPGAPRVYLTGDLGIKLPNGELEFCGRMDSQVKLRGFRIEPEEVIQALRAHDSVLSAAVVTVGEEAKLQLAAYFVSREDITDCDLRAHLEKHLPSYMIPDYLVRVPELPHTSHGKLDRTALPEPQSADTQLEMQELRTELQDSIADILGDLLDSRKLGLNDNFFRLGGHSLLAAQVIMRIRNQLEVDLPLRTIFDFPTVAALSTEVEKRILAVVSRTYAGSTERANTLSH